MSLQVKRIYEERSPQDGLRVLVDRLWPRGLKKEEAAVDLWMKEIAPSTDLRKRFGHAPGQWERFKEDYFRELEAKGALVRELAQRQRHGRITLLYAARDTQRNNAVALSEYLRRHA